MSEALQQLIADPPIQAGVYWLCTIVAVAAALVAAFSRSLVRAAFSLFFTLFALAGYYVLLGADFLAIVQVVVYIGGILALILFGVLLTNRAPSREPTDSRVIYAGAMGVAVALFIVLHIAILRGAWKTLEAPAELTATTVPLGKLLLTKYLLPFEFISLTLIAALLGALYLARREDR